MSNESEFGLALGVGVVTGARSFRIDALGRLTGVTYQQVWTPGENLAECRAPKGLGSVHHGAVVPRNAIRIVAEDAVSVTFEVADPQSMQTIYSTIYGTPSIQRVPTYQDVTVPKSLPVETDKPTEEHGIAGCGHGFYGYYDGSNDYYTQGYVSGVVEGYGEVIIGTRGFRCMKARIIALSIDDKVKSPLRSLVQRNYRDVPMYTDFKDMVKHHKTDVGESTISPDSDPDFWSRTI